MALKNRRLVLKLLLLRRLRNRSKKSSRRMYIRDIFDSRVERGERILVKVLSEDPQYHFRYFRYFIENP